jgi:hypothetical protein
MYIQEYMLYIIKNYVEPFFLKLDNYIDMVIDNYCTNNDIIKTEIKKDTESENDKKYIKDWDIIEEV